MEPFLLKPAEKDYIWGGKRLQTKYGKKSIYDRLAETWECSVHPDGSSWIDSGIYQGLTLKQLISKHPEMMGSHPGKCFPILIKLIDAEKKLSIQVHPDDKYALNHEHQFGKTEMWYVLEANPGAELIYGFSHDMKRETLVKCLSGEELMEHLHAVPVKKGDIFYIEPGTVHAIGAGVVIAEIQQNSNVTYRLYDYGRRDKNGQKRELHIEKALDVLNMKKCNCIRQKLRVLQYVHGCSIELLCRCRYFQVERIIIKKSFHFYINANSFQVILCIEGNGELINKKTNLKMAKGQTIFLPSECGETVVAGEMEILKVCC